METDDQGVTGSVARDEALPAGYDFAEQEQVQAQNEAKVAANPTPPPEPEASRAPAGEQTYVVQMLTNDASDVWIDVTTVMVPPRTRRATVLERALELKPGSSPAAGETSYYRVLDADSAERIPASLEVPATPVLRIGG